MSTVIFGEAVYSLRPARRPISYIHKRAREEGEEGREERTWARDTYYGCGLSLQARLTSDTGLTTSSYKFIKITSGSFRGASGEIHGHNLKEERL